MFLLSIIKGPYIVQIKLACLELEDITFNPFQSDVVIIKKPVQ